MSHALTLITFVPIAGMVLILALPIFGVLWVRAKMRA